MYYWDYDWDMQRFAASIVRKAKRLRKKGLSIPEISRACAISKSTALRYVKDVPIEADSLPRWIDRRNASKIMSQRQKEIANGKAKALIGYPDKRMLAIMGAALYWAEGSKSDFSFSNSSPLMIEVFLHIMRSVFVVREEDIVISIRVYEDLQRKKCLAFWSGVTGIHLDKNTSVGVLEGRKKGKLPYGMCRVRIRKGGLLLKEFSAIINHVKDNL